MKIKITPLIIASAAMLAAALIYADSLGGTFVNDDNVIVLGNPLVADLSIQHVYKIFSYGDYSHYLPVRFLSYSLDHTIWGMSEFGFHLTNVLIHILSAALIAFLVHGMLMSRDGSRAGAAFGAAAAALLFAAHPLQVESVAWISGRKDVLAVFFSLCSFACYYRSYTRPALKGSDFTLLASLVFFLLAMLSKASVAAFPLVIAASECLIEPGPGQDTRKNRVERVLPFFVTGGIVVLIDLFLSTRQNLINDLFGGDTLTHILTISKIPLLYLGKVFYPANLTLSYMPRIEDSFFSPIVLASLAFWVFLLWLLARLARRDRLLCWFAAWFVLNLLPVMNIIPAQSLIADRYFYLPSVGLFGFFAVLFSRLATGGGSRRALAAWIFLIAVVALLGVRAHDRAGDWASDFTLWQTAVEVEPDNPLALSNLGFAYFSRGDQETAVSYYKQALEQDPSFMAALINLAAAQHNNLGQTDEAIKTLKRAIELNSDSVSPLYNLAVVYYNTGDLQMAYIYVLEAMLIDPESERLADFARHLREKAREKDMLLDIPPDLLERLKKLEAGM